VLATLVNYLAYAVDTPCRYAALETWAPKFGQNSQFSHQLVSQLKKRRFCYGKDAQQPGRVGILPRPSYVWHTMNIDWLEPLLRGLNLAGVPILVGGIVLLFRAYKSALEANAETHRQLRETSQALKEENDRLRKSLVSRDTAFLSELEKLDAVVQKSVTAIGELHARKFALLSDPPSDVSPGDIMKDVAKIDSVIEALRRVSDVQDQMNHESMYFRKHVTERLNTLTDSVAQVALRMADNKGRLLVVEFLASKEVADRISSEIMRNGSAAQLLASENGIEEAEQLQLPGHNSDVEN